MLLMSWNVAGWKTTLDHIKRFKGGLSGFLQRHHADVLCLQEVKLTSKALSTDSAALCTEPPGFESFWACNEGSGAQRQGLNGVATYARRGLVLRADAAPLRVPELDREGRCLLTDHGSFVLFNVYVPNHSGGSRLPFKLRWLRALRAAMQRERAAGKAVLLAGDLNLKHRPKDCHWLGRPVRVSRLAELAREPETAPAGSPVAPGGSAAAAAAVAGLLPEERRTLAAAWQLWPEVCESLRGREVRAFETRNSRNGQVFQRWGVFARTVAAVGATPAGEHVRVGDPMGSEEEARGAYSVDGSGVDDDGGVVMGPPSLDAAFVLRRPGELHAGDLVECLRRLAGVELGPKLAQRLSDALGGAPAPPAVQEWLQAALQEDGMVDSFAELHPDAEERFTCWDQYRNRRHENIGSRIDYVLVDRVFFEKHAQRGADLDTRGNLTPSSASAALSAATLGGLSQPSPFAGGGMPALEEEEYWAQFREAASTGIVYTPPQLSDHVATSLLLRGCPAPGGQPAATRDAGTQRCQPHRAARRITDFFGAGAKRPQPLAAGPAAPAKRTATGA